MSNAQLTPKQLAQSMDVPSLFAWALREMRNHDRDEWEWSPIQELWARGTEEVLHHALRMSTDPDPLVRDLAVTVMGQLGCNEERPFYEQTTAALRRVLEKETLPELLNSAAIALGHHWTWNREDFRALPALVRLAGHGDERARYGAAHALCGCDKPEAIAALITLSTDLDEDVRNWATFGLGTQTDVDTPEVRSALWARTTEKDDDLRSEALVGLARRNVPGAFEAVMAELEGDRVVANTFDAAEALADARFIPALERWEDVWKSGSVHYVRAALEACRAQAEVESGLSLPLA